MPKRLNPLIASSAAFANPTELEKEDKGRGVKKSLANFAYNSGKKSNSLKANFNLFIRSLLRFKGP